MRQFARMLKHKITFLSKQENSWEEKYFCFASIKDLSEENFALHENVDFGIVISKHYKIIRTRFLKNISKDMRIKFKDHIYEILKIINEQENDRITQILISQI
jgi:SPP1 family predicted phage head-tail adaptor